MYIELLGSFLTMGLAIALARVTRQWIAALCYLAFAFGLMFAIPGYGVYFAIFLVGGAIACADPTPTLTTGWRRALPIAIALCGMIIGGYNGVGISRTLTPIVSMLSSSIIPGGVFVMGCGAIAVFYAVLVSPDLIRILSGPIFGFLGKISFALYLFHWLVIVEIGTRVFLALGAHWSIATLSLAAAAASLVTAIALAAVLARFVDVPSIGFSKGVSRRIWAVRTSLMS